MFIRCLSDFDKSCWLVKGDSIMGTAAVAYSLEAEQQELFRQMIHNEVDKWVNEIVVDVFDKDSQPSLV